MKFKCPNCGFENIDYLNRTYEHEIDETTECSNCGHWYRYKIEYKTIDITKRR